MEKTLHIVGGGLAGSEAAWQAAELGITVVLHEMRGSGATTPAHQTDQLCELVCSNSFRNDDVHSAIGLLHEEMRRCNSLVMRAADDNKVPAGGALAMDRELFSAAVEDALEQHPRIRIVREEVSAIPPEAENERWILATGPLTSVALTNALLEHTGKEQLAFFDAIAPIVAKESINFDIAWMQSRYDKVGPGGTGKDYINCPMTEAQYHNFIDALIAGDKTEFKDWEKAELVNSASPEPAEAELHCEASKPSREQYERTPYFEACLPIEVMAERGRETLRYGPLKPVGLTNPHNPSVKPYAIVQLRQDNQQGTLWNMVGFQTKLKYGAQAAIFRQIPGLEHAEFERLGGIHRNTFIQSPKLLDAQLRLHSAPHVRMAGQVTGVEGYVESASIGLLAGRFAAAELLGLPAAAPPHTTALGALLYHITTGHSSFEEHPQNSDQQAVTSNQNAPHLTSPRKRGEEEVCRSDSESNRGGGNTESRITNSDSPPTFQPMNINFGLFPPLVPRVRKKERKAAYATRALADLGHWLIEQRHAA